MDEFIRRYLGAIKINPQLTQLVDVVHIHLLLPQQVCHLQHGRHVNNCLTKGELVVVKGCQLTSLKNFSKVHIFWGLTSRRPARIGVRCFLIPACEQIFKEEETERDKF